MGLLARVDKRVEPTILDRDNVLDFWWTRHIYQQLLFVLLSMNWISDEEHLYLFTPLYLSGKAKQQDYAFSIQIKITVDWHFRT